MNTWIKAFCVAVIVAASPIAAFAAISIPFTVNLSEAVTVDTAGGTPRIAVDVGGVTRYATYTTGTGTSTLTFTYDAVIGDVDLDGVTLTSPIQLNGGTIRDAVGNDATLTFTLPNTTGVKVNYPSLGMDFVADADGRYTLNGSVYNNLSGFLVATGGTFSRNSIATYFDSTGTIQTAPANTPRFDYDHVTLQTKGILIEESRTNFIINSSDILNWTASFRNGTAGGLVNSPDGGVNGRLVTLLPSQYYYGRTTTAMPLGNYTASAWLKGTPGYTVGFRIDSTSNGSNQANISVPLTGSWDRVSVSFNLTTASSSIDIGVDDRPSLGGSGTGGSVQIWGGQIEAGAFPTSYIPTTTATVTRAADNLTMPTGSWYSAATGSLFASSDTIPYNASLSGAISISFFNDNSPSNQWGLRYDTGGTLTASPFTRGGVNQTTIYTPPVLTGTNRTAHAMSVGTRSTIANGGPVQTGTYSSTPTISFLNIGNNLSTSYLNGYLKTIKYYPSRVSDTQLQLLTQ
jgi:hypothetical protein